MQPQFPHSQLTF